MMINTPATPLNDAHQAGFFMNLVPFQKPALSIPEQIALLESRGMMIEDHDRADHYLRFIGYYRLSGYWFLFQHRDESAQHDSFRSGTSFEKILDVYIFDRQIRVLVMDAVERIEVAARAMISNTLSEEFGAHWFITAKNFSSVSCCDQFMESVKRAMKQSAEAPSILNYQEKYGSPPYPPSWMVFEIVNFGAVSRLFGCLKPVDQKVISQQFGVHHHLLISWLHAISYLRNVCAHHGRVWNRSFRIQPRVAKSEMHHVLRDDKFYNHAVVIQTLMKRISGDTHWADRLGEILDRHPRIPLDEMGFPPNWQDEEIWQ